MNSTLNRILKLSKVGTIANVYLNGHNIGYLDNIYRTYYLDIDRQYLNANGTQNLRVDIQSTAGYTYARAANYTQDVVEDYFNDL